ncbi:MAG: hypothetical protein J6J18_09535 [Oscillospiraceae bacterium]|nr:hypothetical protein [Oscillospiraceae bacterium]
MKQKGNIFPRLMAVFLLVVILIGMLPLGAFAADTEDLPDATTDPTTVLEETDIPTDPTAQKETEAPTAASEETTAVTEATAAATEEPTDATEIPTDPADETTPVTEVPTEPQEESSEAPTEATEATEAPAETTSGDSVTESEQTTLAATTQNASIEVEFPQGSGLAETSVLGVSEAAPDGQQMTSIMSAYQIESISDCFVFDMTVSDISQKAPVKVKVTFSDPYLMVLGYDLTYLVQVNSDGVAERIEGFTLNADSNNAVTNLEFELTEFQSNTRIILIAADQAKLTGSGYGDLYDNPTVRSTNGQKYHGVGADKGALPNHTWSDTPGPARTDFSICLNKNLPYIYNTPHGSTSWGSGDVSVNISSPSGASPKANHWASIGSGVREKLILLLCYGMDTDSPSARFGTSSDTLDPSGTTGATYAAMQLIAWEWIDGVTEGEYTEHYSKANTRAAQLRELVKTNPDNIDAAATMVSLVWSTMQKNDYGNHWTYGQTLIALTEPPVYKPTAEKFTLLKSIDASADCIAQIQGNPMYSLAGAQYQVSVNGTNTEVLTTDADGKAVSTKEYDIGTVVTIKEISAPQGFKLNLTAYTFTIGTDNTFSVSDEPVFDPPFAITKVDKDTTNPQGNGSFSGAVFKWEYFANTDWSGTATRTWYFQTNANGRVEYDESYLAIDYTSDALYYSSDGTPNLPLGSVKITEIKNSLGYTVLSRPLYCSIVEDAASSEGAKFVWTAESLQSMLNIATGNYGVYEPIDTTIFGSLTVDKIDAVTGTTAQGGATLQGAKFQVINNSANSVKIGNFAEAEPGQVCYEFYTDANGHHESGSIFPLGSYTVIEVAAPTGYKLNTAWSQSFTVTGDQKDFAFTTGNGTACPETVITGGLRIVKQEALAGDSTGSDAMMEGISFSVISENEQPVVVNGTTYQKGETVLTLGIKWDGSRWTAETGANVLPYGVYTVKENPWEPGSSLANDYYLLNTTPQTITIQQDQDVPECLFTNELRPGSIKVEKVDPTGAHLAGASFKLLWSNDGVQWTPVTFTDTPATSGGCTSAGLNDGVLTTDGSGIIEFTGLDPRLQYRLVEVKAPNGYSLLTSDIYNGTLPTGTAVVSLRVVNAPMFQLPKTGSAELAAMPIAVAFLLALGGILLLMAAQKRRET